MGADRMNLADDSDRHAFLGGGEGGPLAGEPGPDYENVMGWHGRGCYTAELRGRSRDSSLCNSSRWGSYSQRSARRRTARSERSIALWTVEKSTFAATSLGQW